MNKDNTLTAQQLGKLLRDHMQTLTIRELEDLACIVEFEIWERDEANDNLRTDDGKL